MTIAKSNSSAAFETQVSCYDQVSGWLKASIIVFGVLLLTLLTMLLREKTLARSIFPPPPGETTKYQPALMPGDELVDPGMEAPELQTELINLEQFDPQVLGTAISHALGKKPGKGDKGDERTPGPCPPPGKKDIAKRWQINYELSDFKTYTAQLRHFNIDMGLVSRTTNAIWRINDPGDANTIIESNRENERLSQYFVGGKLMPAPENSGIANRRQRWDQRIVAESKISLPGSEDENVILVQFYPPETVDQLLALEANAIPKGKSIEDIKKTCFRLKAEDGTFRFELTKIQFD